MGNRGLATFFNSNLLGWGLLVGWYNIKPIELHSPYFLNNLGCVLSSNIIPVTIPDVFTGRSKYGDSDVSPWISKIDTSERDMKQLTEFLSNTEKEEFSHCKDYLENNPSVLLKWYQINTEQGGYSVGQWVAWTEMSLDEIDTYNY